MAVSVEILEKLERRLTLAVPTSAIESEVQTRLKKLARSVKMDGFRPGKVPLSVVTQRYGYSVQHEVLNDQVGAAFAQAAQAAELRIAGQPRITEQTSSAPAGEMIFEAVFEVYPEVKIADLQAVEIEKFTAQVDEAAIDKTLEVLRKQRRTFSQRAKTAPAENGDRVTADFEGKIDGEAFAGGRAQDFQFILGEGRMLKEFEAAVCGMKLGESKTFQLAFPADYHGQEVAGKTADFIVTLKKVEAAHLPEVNAALAKSLGVADATVEGLRADIQGSLERELNMRLRARNRQAVLDALVSKAELDLPKVSVQAEIARLREEARAALKERGLKDTDQAPLPDDLFQAQAERRVRLGLVVAELVRRHNLRATPEQVQAYVEELAASYEKPAEVVRWYYGDKQRLAEAEATIVDNNVTEFVLKQAKVQEKQITFDELMAQG